MKNQLIIAIDYDRSLRAEDIGALFSALAKDYKTVSRGRVLVVASIDHGSIIATLVDWALQVAPYVKGSIEVAKGAKALADFGKLLKDGIKAAKSPEAKTLPQPSGSKRSVQRSVNALLKTAADNGCNIRVKHTGADGETFEVEMTAPQAVDARRRIEEPKTIPHPAVDELRQVQIPPIGHALGRLYAPDASTYSANEAQAVVDSLFAVLEATGQTDLIPQVAASLSQKGLYALADALQAKMDGLDRRGEPPLTMP